MTLTVDYPSVRSVVLRQSFPGLLYRFQVFGYIQGG